MELLRENKRERAFDQGVISSPDRQPSKKDVVEIVAGISFPLAAFVSLIDTLRDEGESDSTSYASCQSK